MPQTTNTESPSSKLTAFFGISIQIVLIVFLARFIMDIGNRMVYPFIPQISTGLGLTIVGFSWLLSVRSLVGIAGPIFGLLSDRYGRRQMMAGALLCEAVGAVGLALSWSWWATTPIILFGLSVAAFIPAQQAYISDKVPYQKRGRAMATIEFAWSASAIIPLPIIGWMIDSFGWRTPFFTLAVLGLIGSVMTWRQLPPVDERQSRTQLSWAESRDLLLNSRVAASIGTALLLFFAATIFLTIWGVWLNATFYLNASQLGWVATMLGLAELGGAITAGLFIDRIGIKRGGSLGLLLTAVALLTLPFVQTNLWLAVAALTILSLVFEFTIVSLLPLYSEQVPTARGTVFSLVFFGIGIGSAIAAPVATILWERAGLWADSVVAALALLTARWLVQKFLREKTSGPLPSQ